MRAATLHLDAEQPEAYELLLPREVLDTVADHLRPVEGWEFTR
jgi:hypothetical protein